jgi:hypothetical protein
MEQEWQATAVAIDVRPPSDEQFGALNKRIRGVVRHDDNNRLTMVWRFKARTVEEAIEMAGNKATYVVDIDLGNYGKLRQLHVVHADEVEVDPKALAALGLTES